MATARKKSDDYPDLDPKGWPQTLRLGEALQAQIDEWRRWEPDLPPRAEAVRRLLEIGLDRGGHK
jgi:hypothetical protein